MLTDARLKSSKTKLKLLSAAAGALATTFGPSLMSFSLSSLIDGASAVFISIDARGVRLTRL